MLNHICAIGRLTHSPELRRTGSGVAVTSFTIACDRDFKNKDTGEKETDFLDVIAWRTTAEFVAKYIGKADLVAVSGRLQILDWTAKDGTKRRAAEINAESVYKLNRSDAPAAAPTPTEDPYEELTDDDGKLPF